MREKKTYLDYLTLDKHAIQYFKNSKIINFKIKKTTTSNKEKTFNIYIGLW